MSGPKTEMRTFLLEAFTLCYAFTAAAFWANPPSIADDPWGLLRLAIPASAALLGLLLWNVYAVPQEMSGPGPAFIDGIVALACAFLTQLVLSRLAPQFCLPLWTPTQGGLWGPEFLVVIRRLLPPPGRMSETRQATTAGGSKNPGECSGTSGGSTGTCRRRWYSPRSSRSLSMDRSACGWGLSDATDSLRLIRWIECWYVAALIPGILVILFGSQVYSYLVLLPVSLAAVLVDRAAARHKYQIDPRSQA